MSHNADETPAHHASTVGLPACEYAGLFAAERRRLALDVLSERTVPVEIDELAAEIAARGEGSPTDVVIDLHHSHLPKLDEADVVDYDPESHVVESMTQPVRADGTSVAGGTDDGENVSRGIELRTHVVEYFDASTGETASLDDLARYAATRLSDATDWPAERVRLRLHHAVLPRLADTGVIDYDSRTTTVRFRTESV